MATTQSAPIEGLVFDWVKLVTGYDDLNIVRANQNGAQPVGDYVTYLIFTDTPDPLIFKQREAVDPEGANEDVLATYASRMTLTVQVDVYAKDGRQQLRKLLNSDALFTVRKIFQDENTVLAGAISEVRDLTELGDTDYEPRFEQDFSFRNWSNITETYEQIKEWEINGEFESPNGNKIPVEIEV